MDRAERPVYYEVIYIGRSCLHASMQHAIIEHLKSQGYDSPIVFQPGPFSSYWRGPPAPPEQWMLLSLSNHHIRLSKYPQATLVKFHAHWTRPRGERSIQAEILVVDTSGPVDKLLYEYTPVSTEDFKQRLPEFLMVEPDISKDLAEIKDLLKQILERIL